MNISYQRQTGYRTYANKRLMKPAAIYMYHYRAGYGSENLLIKILRGAALEHVSRTYWMR